MSMATGQKQPSPLPHPRKARLDAGLSWRGLAAAAGIGMATISRAEKTGQWPKDRGTRVLYLHACGLPTGLEPRPKDTK